MNLSMGKGYDYLSWKNFRFGSDSILASFRYSRYRKLLEEVPKTMPNYQSFIEDFIHRTYTIGGSIIFPKKIVSIEHEVLIRLSKIGGI